jgi:hypothetical protein
LYTCVVCNEALFTSETKFDSGCGWPAFNDVIDQKKVKLTTDTSNGMFWFGSGHSFGTSFFFSCICRGIGNAPYLITLNFHYLLLG